ncbi:hypothetical protein TL16_g01602 [Triparma laevis f. inornata]|uniref:tRNA(Phe) 7-[(3-amino-3-carboxypropyl)-4-demethylwyosine(37)-N(4)]-methyltransferase n=1 Tax=Triparma laevis f. inornata TaxID=1714386 RepID=A0A9W6ZKW4_9STRA|nr:hypothetical protein TL16_g01602 [Triparma laevis f. inornata]
MDEKFILITSSYLVMSSFLEVKNRVLSKRDRSSRGRIDQHAVTICSLINSRPEYYTTSSCSGRFHLYRGVGNKSDNADTKKSLGKGEGGFDRFRIHHGFIKDGEEARRYFNLETLEEDPEGGGIRLWRLISMRIWTLGKGTGRGEGEGECECEGDGEEEEEEEEEDSPQQPPPQSHPSIPSIPLTFNESSLIWLRYESFILHVCAISLPAADALMSAARRAGYKTVGVQSSGATSKVDGKVIVQILGDEFLETPLFSTPGYSEILAKMVNDRQRRNWDKIGRFEREVKGMVYEEGRGGRKHYDVVGDVAVVKDVEIKVVAVQNDSLSGVQKRSNLTIVAGNHSRMGKDGGLVTTHQEFGIKCLVDLNRTFFTARMGPERIRLCNCVSRGENVLSLFSGVGLEGLMIAGRREISGMTFVEINPVAVNCLRRGLELLGRNKAVVVKGGGMAAKERVKILEGDALAILSDLSDEAFDRIIAPRPKEGGKDGDLSDGIAGAEFLKAMLPKLKERGEVHWYDFAADHEVEGGCERTKKGVEDVVGEMGWRTEWLHAGKAGSGSIAKRQFRVCVDFRVHKKD